MEPWVGGVRSRNPSFLTSVQAVGRDLLFLVGLFLWLLCTAIVQTSVQVPSTPGPSPFAALARHSPFCCTLTQSRFLPCIPQYLHDNGEYAGFFAQYGEDMPVYREWAIWVTVSIGTLPPSPISQTTRTHFVLYLSFPPIPNSY